MALKQRDVLAALRAVGPCSNRDLARALRVPAADCYAVVAPLRAKGFASRLGEELYDATSEGRRELPTRAGLAW